MTRGLPKIGDVVMTTEGPMGEVAQLDAQTVKYALGQRIVCMRGRKGVLDNTFPKFLLISPDQQAILHSYATGITVAGISQKSLRSIPIMLPIYRDQTIIGQLLAALDDKIELNRRLNDTLGEMTRATFIDWFVDFGPTSALAEGRTPYLAPDLWSLFPSGLDDKGVPVGWEIQSVFSQANWVNGAAYKDMYFNNASDALPVIKIAELKNGVTANTKFTNTSLGDRYRIDNGELLFSWSGNPDTSIDTFLWTHGKAWLNQHIFAVRPNGSRSICFLYSMLKFLRPEMAEIARNKQTTGLGHVTLEDLRRLKICIPDAAVESAFEALVEPIRRRFFQNLIENQTLAQTRDFLLPNLMSGEICVTAAKRLLEAVA